MEAVGKNDVLPYKINSSRLTGSAHGKNTAITCLEVAPEIELYSISNLNKNIDYVIKEGIRIVFASIGEITLNQNTLKKVKDNDIILIKSGGNVGGMPVSDANKSGDWIVISSVGLSSKNEIYHSQFSSKHSYIDFASFGYVTLPSLPDDTSFAKHFTGTSFSCPIIAGVAAIILEDAKNKGFKLGRGHIYKIFQDNSSSYNLKKNEVGNGVIKLPNNIDYDKYVKSEGKNGLGGGDMEFKDVDKDKWYYDAIKYAADNKLMIGYKDNTFRPDNNITRAEVAQIIYNITNNK